LYYSPPVWAPPGKFGTPFTPEHKFQVQGGIGSLPSHQIFSAGCSIALGHDEQMIKALATECLIRQLGLTGAFEKVSNALMGLWNRGNSVSRETSSECKPFVYSRGKRNQVGWPEKCIVKYKWTEPPWTCEKHVGAFTASTAYDRFLIKIHYDPRVRPGMKKSAVLPIV